MGLYLSPYSRQTFVVSSKVLKGDISSDLLLEDFKYLSAMLIYMHSQGLMIPPSLQNLLGTQKFPALTSY